MLGIHVRLNLEYESGELIAFGIDDFRVCRPWQRRGRKVNKPIEHLVYTKVSKRRAKIDRSQLPCKIGSFIKLMAGTFHQLDLILELFKVITQKLRGVPGIEILDNSRV